MGRYVVGFVIPVPKRKRAAYLRLSQLTRDVWMDHGALEYQECVGDDVKPGKVTSFPQAVKLKAGEVVVFSWVVYASKRERDRHKKEGEEGPAPADMMDPEKLPFGGKRMFFGGFVPR